MVKYLNYEGLTTLVDKIKQQNIIVEFDGIIELNYGYPRQTTSATLKPYVYFLRLTYNNSDFCGGFVSMSQAWENNSVPNHLYICNNDTVYGSGINTAMISNVKRIIGQIPYNNVIYKDKTTGKLYIYNDDVKNLIELNDIYKATPQWVELYPNISSTINSITPFIDSSNYITKVEKNIHMVDGRTQWRITATNKDSSARQFVLKKGQYYSFDNMCLTAGQSGSWVVDLGPYPQNGTYIFTYM